MLDVLCLLLFLCLAFLGAGLVFKTKAFRSRTLRWIGVGASLLVCALAWLKAIVIGAEIAGRIAPQEPPSRVVVTVTRAAHASRFTGIRSNQAVRPDLRTP
jgi:hypothetical protein